MVPPNPDNPTALAARSHQMKCILKQFNNCKNYTSEIIIEKQPTNRIKLQLVVLTWDEMSTSLHSGK